MAKLISSPDVKVKPFGFATLNLDMERSATKIQRYKDTKIPAPDSRQAGRLAGWQASEAPKVPTMAVSGGVTGTATPPSTSNLRLSAGRRASAKIPGQTAGRLIKSALEGLRFASGLHTHKRGKKRICKYNKLG